MFKRGFYLAACGAVVLLLTAVETSHAQFVTFPIGRGGVGAFAPRGVGFFPAFVGSRYYGSPYYGSPYYGSPYYGPSSGYNPSFYQPGYSSYTVNTVTPLYYGATSMAPAYSTAYTPSLVSPPLNSLATTDGATSAAYSTPTYPLRTPDYNVVHPISPPLSGLTDNTAEVEAHVPLGAHLYFDGHATSQTGPDRSFTTPPLEPKQDYVYEVRAHWDAAGKPVDETRKVTVHAGDHLVVDFHKGAAAK